MLRLKLDDQIIEGAGITEITSAIFGLDGVTRTLVLIEWPSGRTLTIGGGPDRFVAELAEDDRKRWCVVQPSSPEGSIDIVVGGQTVDYPLALCIDRESVLEAARTFTSNQGVRSPKLEWSQQT